MAVVAAVVAVMFISSVSANDLRLRMRSACDAVKTAALDPNGL